MSNFGCSPMTDAYSLILDGVAAATTGFAVSVNSEEDTWAQFGQCSALRSSVPSSAMAYFDHFAFGFGSPIIHHRPLFLQQPLLRSLQLLCCIATSESFVALVNVFWLNFHGFSILVNQRLTGCERLSIPSLAVLDDDEIWV